MNKFLISATLALSAFAPALGHAMIFEDDVVASILGPKMPSSDVRVGKVNVIYYNSVYHYDNILDLTNRVLNRSIRADVVRVHTDLFSGKIGIAAAKRNQQAMEQHCQLRLTADGIKNPAGECGNGLNNR